MKPKKNPKADLNKRTVLFLQLGLIIVLLLAYLIINWRNKNHSAEAIVQPTYETPEEETIPLTELRTTPPPKLPKAPEIIDIVPDDIDKPEDKIASTESTQEEPSKVEDIVEAEPEETIETIPVDFIQQVPVFPGCESLTTNEERKACMNDEISRFVNSHVDTDLASELGLSGRNRVIVLFKIDTQGNVVDIQSRAPHPGLEQEAKRVISALPKMKPGRQGNKPVNVSYALPIIFNVEN